MPNPLYADVRGLPPLYLSAGTHETLQDNADRFAALARSAGIDVTLEHSEGQQHIYPIMAGRAPEADATIAAAGTWLRRQLATARPGATVCS